MPLPPGWGCLEIASFVRGEASLLCAFSSSLIQLQFCCALRVASPLLLLPLLQSISSFQFQYSAERCKIEIILRPGTSLKCREQRTAGEGREHLRANHFSPRNFKHSTCSTLAALATLWSPQQHRAAKLRFCRQRFMPCAVHFARIQRLFVRLPGININRKWASPTRLSVQNKQFTTTTAATAT